MNSKSSAVVALVLVSFVVIWVAYSVVTWSLKSMAGLDARLSGAIVAACATVFVSVLTVVYTQNKTKSREIDNSHRPEKMKIYKDFMDKSVIGILRASKSSRVGTPEFQAEMEEVFFRFTGDVIMWGSPAVVNAYSSFRKSSGSNLILLRMDELLQAMRSDLGNSNFGLERGALMKLFITDPDSLDELL